MNQIEFYINGQLQTIQKNDSNFGLPLSDYIRDVMNIKGTKIMCHEGGCGVCAITAHFFDINSNSYKNLSINSCLFPLYACHGLEFFTIEALSDLKNDKIHPIQKRLADYNGSQCGYCSPGIVMNMFSILSEERCPEKKTIENSLDGNICRCTGYRSILDAMKSFCADENPVDIEDIQNLTCLKREINASNSILKKIGNYFYPESIDELSSVILECSSKDYKLVAGNTSAGIWKNEEKHNFYILTNLVKEFKKIELFDNKIIFGAGVTITQMIDYLEKFDTLKEVANLLKKIGNRSIRNVATWSGNLVIKNKQNDFPSDLFVAFETIGAKLLLRDALNQCDIIVKPSEFIKIDLNGKFIRCVTLDKSNLGSLKLVKVMPRSQNSYSYVTAGFKIEFDCLSQRVLQEPLILFSGIDLRFFNAKKTQVFLLDKVALDKNSLQDAIKILADELEPLKLSNYKKSLCLSLFYKYLLEIAKSTIDPRVISAIDSIYDLRTLSKGIQKFQTNDKLFPLTKPISKLTSLAQTNGQSVYTNDLPIQPNQLHASFILATQANCFIDKIHIEEGLLVKGVVSILLANDIPGLNNVCPSNVFIEELFSSGKIEFAGQPIGLVIANNELIAKQVAKSINVTYKEKTKPILTINDAIQKNSFHPKIYEDYQKGDVKLGLDEAPLKLSGTYSTEAQYHFYMENISATCRTSDEGGFEVECSSQWLDYLQKAICQVLKIQASKIEVNCKNVGGAFGGKSTRSALVAAAATLASYHTRCPVKLTLDLNESMKIMGKRFPCLFKYEVGFDEDGRLKAISIDWFSDAGYLAADDIMDFGMTHFDNAYYCPNWLIKPILVKTNTPLNTAFRAPYTFPAITTAEYIVDHVARYLNKDPLETRMINLYKKDQLSHFGQPQNENSVKEIINGLIEQSNYHARLSDVKDFNSKNKWKKKGISVIPMKYPALYKDGYYSAQVTIFNTDGSVAITHGGIEIGQGIHTKVAQVCANELGIPLELISVKTACNTQNANSQWTGGSVTTELIAKAVIGCCNQINANLDSIRLKMKGDYTWKELIENAFSEAVDLSARFWLKPPTHSKERPLDYEIYAAACSEVLIDSLTGELQIIRSDLCYDVGQSLNSMIDIGQAEGAFVMGLGFWFHEKTRYDSDTGELLTNSTSNYYPPMAKDIPIDFRISFLENSRNTCGPYGSKCIGEPPLVLSLSALFAVKRAIEAAREEHNDKNEFVINAPCLPGDIQQLCLANFLNFNF